MAQSSYIKNFTHGSIIIRDGTQPTPLEVSLDCDSGDISLTGLVDGLYEIIKYERRGRLKSVAPAALASIPRAPLRRFGLSSRTPRLARFRICSAARWALAMPPASGPWGWVNRCALI